MNKSMTCEAAETLLHQSLDAALTQPERVALESHWEVCVACRRERDAQRQMAQITGRWAEQALALSDPGDAFTAQILSRLEAPPKHSPLWLSLLPAAAALLLAALAFLPGLPGTSASTLVLSLDRLPHWLTVNLLALPGDALALRHLPQTAFVPSWMSVLLPTVVGLNAVFCLYARQSSLRRSVS
jgi:hypothetical protein